MYSYLEQKLRFSGFVFVSQPSTKGTSLLMWVMSALARAGPTTSAGQADPRRSISAAVMRHMAVTPVMATTVRRSGLRLPGGAASSTLRARMRCASATWRSTAA